MITNFDIEELSSRLNLPLIGIVNKDRLDTLPKDLGSYYINMQNYDAGEGTHWSMLVYIVMLIEIVIMMMNIVLLNVYTLTLLDLICRKKLKNILKNLSQ